MRATTPAEALLAGWLRRLVDLLLAAGGPVARQLERCVLDKTASLRLDDAWLQLSACRDAAGELAVEIAAGEGEPARQLATSGEALRDILEGRALLDAAVADGRVDLRAPLAELLAFHELAMLALALGPRSPGLRALWADFDAAWPSGAPRCVPLAQQAARHGALVQAVPLEVRLARSPAANA
ncbi:MAG TPA: hypothetical protein VLA16_00370 [Ideonella sp.]|nr:hypothetical protein [Ideonella sp.]